MRLAKISEKCKCLHNVHIDNYRFCFAIMSFSSTFPLNGDLLLFSWIIQCQFSGCCYFTQPTYTHSRACCEKLHYSHPTHPHLQVAKTRLIQRKERMGKWLGWTKNKTRLWGERVSPPTLTMYVTPGPEIFSFESSHPLEGLLTSPPPPPGFQSSPLGWCSSSLLFLLMLTDGSSCEQGVEWEAELHRETPAPEAAAVAALGLGPLEQPEPDPPPPCSFDTARSLTAEGRPFMPSKLPELLNFRPDTLLMSVQRVVPPSSRWSEPWPVGLLEGAVAEEGWTSVGGV